MTKKQEKEFELFLKWLKKKKNGNGSGAFAPARHLRPKDFSRNHFEDSINHTQPTREKRHVKHSGFDPFRYGPHID